MNDWIPCAYAVGLIGIGMALAGVASYLLGCWREQLRLLEILRPEI